MFENSMRCEKSLSNKLCGKRKMWLQKDFLLEN